MRLYVTCQQNGSESHMVYDGQDQETVTRILTAIGATDIQFITQEQYRAAMRPH